MQRITKKMLGLKKSPKDRRDFVLTVPLTDPNKLPTQYNRTSEMTPVRSQGSEGACVGFAAVTGIKEYQEKKEHSRFISLSPRYVYEKAKKLSGHSSGTTLIAAMQVLKSCGVCEEKYWSYVPNGVGLPSQGFETNARKYKIRAYFRLRSLHELKQAVFYPKICLCMIGVKVYRGMMGEECRKTGIVKDPNCFERGYSRGGHALTVCGYTDDSPYFKDGHFKVKNCWGEDFGDRGYLYLSYSYVKANMLDAFSCLDIKDSRKYEIEKLGNRIEWSRK